MLEIVYGLLGFFALGASIARAGQRKWTQAIGWFGFTVLFWALGLQHHEAQLAKAAVGHV